MIARESPPAPISGDLGDPFGALPPPPLPGRRATVSVSKAPRTATPTALSPELELGRIARTRTDGLDPAISSPAGKAPPPRGPLDQNRADSALEDDLTTAALRVGVLRRSEILPSDRSFRALNDPEALLDVPPHRNDEETAQEARPVSAGPVLAAAVTERLAEAVTERLAEPEVPEGDGSGRPWSESWRWGDNGLGVPDPRPTGGRWISTEETAAFEAQEAAVLRERVLRQLAEEGSPGTFRWPKPLLRWASSACLLLACVLGLVSVAQLASFYQVWETIPQPWNWVMGGLVVALAAIIAGYLLRFFGFALRLRGNHQVSLKAIQALQERRELQSLAAEQASEAVQRLRTYLTDYPADLGTQAPGSASRGRRIGRGGRASRSGGHRAGTFGVSGSGSTGLPPEREAVLVRARASLLERSRGNAPAQWIAEYVSVFQKPLDALAAQRVDSYARRAGLATAASPNPLLDQMIIAYTCTAMLGDLLKLYHLRPSFGQSAILLGQCVAQTFLAGVAGEGAEEAADQLGQGLAEWIPAAGSGIAKGLGARTAEGGLNWFLVRRLGRAAIRILQPVRT